MPEDKRAYQDIKKNWQAYQNEQRLINEQYAAEQEKRTLSGQYQAGTQAAPRGARDNTRNVQAAYAQPAAQSYTSVPVVRRKKKKKKEASVAKTNIARARVSGINFWIWGNVATFYVLQLMLALISTVALGMWFAIETTAATATAVAGEGGRAGFSIGGAIHWAVTRVVAAGLWLFDFNTDFFNPLFLFLIAYAAVIFFGIFQLLVTWFMYRMSFVNSLSGKASGAKAGAFILALVGYCIPILNLFPLIIPWTIVVWFNPK